MIMDASIQARIRELEIRIEQLKEQNKKLQNSCNEYRSLKNNMNNLMETYFSRRKRDLAALTGAGLQSSRCMDSFIRKMTDRIQEGIPRSLSQSAQSVEEKIVRKYRKDEEKIDANLKEIRAIEKEINSLRVPAG